MERSSDWIDLLLAFNEANVEYLIIGALAVSFHSVPRSTSDMDVWVRPTRENAHRVFAALAAFGAPLDDIAEADFAGDDLVYMMGRPPFRIDVLTSIDGVDFASAWVSRVTSELYDVPVAFIGRAELIQNKRATGRDKDLLDLRRLECAESDER